MRLLKKYFWCIFLFFLILCLLYPFYINQNQQLHERDMQLSKLNELLAVEKIYNSTYETNRDFEIFLNGKIIPFDSKVLGEKNEEIILKEMVKNNAIVLRYSELHCNACVDTMIHNLINVSKEMDNGNIILLVTSQDTKYITLLKKRKHIVFPIYRLTNEMDELLKDIDIPYYFVIQKNDKNMRINSVFVPLKENQELTYKYLNHVIQDYFK